jgi:DNA (cytosine-5)-methyltransferase 1
MADPRGNLALVFLRLLERTRARWVVWENVPGVLSSAGGRDFGAFLGALGQLGYGWAYRVLDAQYFGLAQRRKRVFVVGCAGGLTNRAAAVLFERACLRGDPAPSREAGARVAGCLDGGAHGGGFDHNDARAGKCVDVALPLRAGRTYADTGDGSSNVVAHTVAAHASKGGDPTTDNYVTHSLRADGFDASEDGTGRGTPIIAATLSHGGNPGSNAPGRRKEDDGNLVPTVFGSQMSTAHWAEDMSDTLQAKNPKAVSMESGVRRLTPRECERLQGFPDNYTLVPHRGKPASDGPRYRALGNSMAVPVMAWIGKRIQMVEDITP